MYELKLLGNKLKELRLQKEKSLEEVAQSIGSTKSLLSKYERGASVPGLTPIIKLSKYYGISLDDLVDALKL